MSHVFELFRRVVPGLPNLFHVRMAELRTAQLVEPAPTYLPLFSVFPLFLLIYKSYQRRVGTAVGVETLEKVFTLTGNTGTGNIDARQACNLMKTHREDAVGNVPSIRLHLDSAGKQPA
jgi:hypothetical protein